MNAREYHAGETVEATIDFLHGDRVESVTATFAHVEGPETKFHLSGTPDQEVASGGAGYTYWRVVLSGKVTVENKLGTYHCETVEAEYPGGLKIPFGGVPDASLQIAEADIPPPEITGTWEWGSGS